jgi:hypothetical protein
LKDQTSQDGQVLGRGSCLHMRILEARLQGEKTCRKQGFVCVCVCVGGHRGRQEGKEDKQVTGLCLILRGSEQGVGGLGTVMDLILSKLPGTQSSVPGP